LSRCGSIVQIRGERNDLRAFFLELPRAAS
jgi:hypothetical protein